MTAGTDNEFQITCRKGGTTSWVNRNRVTRSILTLILCARPYRHRMLVAAMAERQRQRLEFLALIWFPRLSPQCPYQSSGRLEKRKLRAYCFCYRTGPTD